MTGDDTRPRGVSRDDRIVPFSEPGNFYRGKAQRGARLRLEAMGATKTITRATIGPPTTAERKQFRDAIARAEGQQ